MGMTEKIQAILASKGASKETLRDGAGVLAEAIADALLVKKEEVAILVLTTSGQTLRFMWPPALYESLAAFPANHKNAIASHVLSTMKGKVDNKLSESKHLRFYENVKGMETSKLPIQKMVALPLVAGSRTLGVVEVSRKGRTPEDAGANFSPEDAQRLVALCKEAAPLLAQLVPAPFV